MELKNKYFHSVHSYLYNKGEDYKYRSREKELDDILYKFECIFKSGRILPYDAIKNLYGYVNRYGRPQYNDDYLISVSLHEDNPEPLDIAYLNEIEEEDGYCENAFRMFPYQEPSIVLNERTKELKHYICPVIYLERQFREPIPLEYMDAISIYPGQVTPFFDDIKEDKYDYYLELAKKEFKRENRYIDLAFLDKMIELLSKYNYDVPIIDITTGNEYHENEEYRKVLEKIKK